VRGRRRKMRRERLAERGWARGARGGGLGWGLPAQLQAQQEPVAHAHHHREAAGAHQPHALGDAGPAVAALVTPCAHDKGQVAPAKGVAGGAEGTRGNKWIGK
jgi:hypothetical protein